MGEWYQDGMNASQKARWEECYPNDSQMDEIKPNGKMLANCAECSQNRKNANQVGRMTAEEGECYTDGKNASQMDGI
jgi:hypothetical protein